MLSITFRTFWFLVCYIAASSDMLGCIGYINDPRTFPGQEPCGFWVQEIWNGNRLKSVTIGDFNGDSHPDLAVRTSEELFVLLNTGEGNYSPPIRTALPYVGAWPTSDYGGRAELAADFNGDRRLDLALSDRNEILFGRGDGTFLAPQAIGGEHPTFYGLTAIGDFDGDQKPDLVFFVSGSLAILLGNGDGTFRLGSTAEMGSGSLYVADINRDDRSDLVVIPFCPGFQNCSVSTFLGHGDGSFRAPVISETTWTGSLVVADFNQDGRLDIAGATAVLLGNGDGSFQAPQRFFDEPRDTPAGPASAADLDGDGHMDLVYFDSSEARSIYGLLGRGDGVLVPINPSSYWLHLWELTDRRVVGISDLDGDGRPDIVTADFGSPDWGGYRHSSPSEPKASVMILLNRVEGATR
jgi:hypothetical protein